MKLKAVFIICLLVLGYGAFAQGSVTANFTSDITSGCSPIVVNFQDQSTGNPTAWVWDFGNGATSSKQNPSTTYFANGTYTVKLTASNAGSSNTVTKTAYITVYLEPLPNFTVNRRSGCTPTKIQFNDASSSPAGTQIVGWKWDFGDGGSSSQENPQYIYKTPGSYTVTLTITNDKGCKKIITKPNLIDATQGVAPDFYFSDPAVCSAPATVKFTNTTTGPGTLSYSWNFGNGSISSAINPSTVYNKNGKYNVTLIATSNQGCMDSVKREVDIGKANTDFIIPTKLCPKTPVQFLNNSSPRPIKALWQFSNGTTDTFRNGSTVFATAGTYIVTLINTYTACTDTLKKTVTVLPNPVVDFKASDTGRCQTPFSVNFTPSGGVSYIWDFGDSTATSTQTNPTHTYNKGGDFDVTLIAANSNGCNDTLVKKAYIKIRKPVIKFPNLPAEGCIPHAITFSSNISSADSVISYKWEFGDGNSSTEKSPNYIYTKSGKYDVTLTVTTSTGCTEMIKLDSAVKVDTLPTPAFTSDVTTACADPGIQFINLTVDPKNEFQYTWTFSDGTTSGEKNPRHTFTDTGWIDVSLSVNNKGCETKLTKLRYAYIKPAVSRFDYKPDCNNRLRYTFIDKSIAATSWKWNFGDGTTYTGQNPPPHTFPADGSYNVSLTTTNGTCTYTLVRSVVIAGYTPDFTTPFTEGCKPFTVTIYPILPNPERLHTI